MTGCVGHIYLLFWTSIYRCSFFFYCQLLMMMGSMQESWPPLWRVRPETFPSMLMTWKMDVPLFASHRKRKVSWVSWKFYCSVSFRKYLCRVHLLHCPHMFVNTCCVYFRQASYWCQLEQRAGAQIPFRGVRYQRSGTHCPITHATYPDAGKLPQVVTVRCTVIILKPPSFL